MKDLSHEGPCVLWRLTHRARSASVITGMHTGATCDKYLTQWFTDLLEILFFILNEGCNMSNDSVGIGDFVDEVFFHWIDYFSNFLSIFCDGATWGLCSS